MTLHEKQDLFTRLLPKLLDKAHGLGFEVTMGECYRSPEQAKLNAEKGIGIADSVHCLRLAVDVLLFLKGVWLSQGPDMEKAYTALGQYWVTLDSLCRWGGNFKRADGRPRPDFDHFSLIHEGRS